MAKPKSKPRILIVEDDNKYVHRLRSSLWEDYDCEAVTSAGHAAQQIETREYDVILLDLELEPGKMNGLDFLERHFKDLAKTPVIVVTRSKDMESIAQAFKLGAFHYHTKERRTQELRWYLKQALKWREMKLQIYESAIGMKGVPGDRMIVRSPSFSAVLEEAKKVADAPTPVLVTGETGVGKTILARYIHEQSGREGAFAELSCGAIPGDLLVQELYGRDDDSGSKRGVFEYAHNGTLLLEGFCDISIEDQRKLTKAIDEGRVYRIGSSKVKNVNTRIVATTSRDLEKLVEEYRFFPALYFSLNRFRIHIPPLRERREDLDALIDYYIDYQAHRLNRRVTGITKAARAYLQIHTWPGNVRELNNAIESAVIRRGIGSLVATDFYLPTDEAGPLPEWKEAKDASDLAFMRRYVLRLMEMTGGNVTDAAKIADVATNQIYRWLRRLEMKAEDFRAGAG